MCVNNIEHDPFCDFSTVNSSQIQIMRSNHFGLLQETRRQKRKVETYGRDITNPGLSCPHIGSHPKLLSSTFQPQPWRKWPPFRSASSPSRRCLAEPPPEGRAGHWSWNTQLMSRRRRGWQPALAMKQLAGMGGLSQKDPKGWYGMICAIFLGAMAEHPLGGWWFTRIWPWFLLTGNEVMLRSWCSNV